MKVHLKKAKTAGFSLVELLVVIAVIGIMAAIAIPMISNINANATAAKTKRNAQQIASVYGAAVAAGATFTGTDLTAILGELKTGKSGAAPFDQSNFKIDLEAAEITAATPYLDVDATKTPPMITYSGVGAE